MSKTKSGTVEIYPTAFLLVTCKFTVMPKLKTVIHKPTSKRKAVVQQRPQKVEVGATALSYIAVDKTIKKLAKEKDDYKNVLVAHLDKKYNPKKPHDSYSCTVEHAGRHIELNMTARSTTVARPDFAEIIERDFPAFKKKLIATFEVLDMDALEVLVKSGAISERNAKKLVDISTNYAFQMPKIID